MNIGLALLLMGEAVLYGRKGRGGEPGAFLSWGAGARSLGMGRAFVAISDDASATYWNPAGLAQLDKKEVTALHALLWEGTLYDFISYAHPLPHLGTLGVNITRLGLGGFKETTWEEPYGTGKTFSDSQSAYGVSFGKQLLENLALGAQMRYLSHTLGDHTSGHFTVDTGLMFRSVSNFLEDLKIGLNLQNILSFNTGDTSEKLPMRLRLGAAYKIMKNWTLASDIQVSEYATRWHLGTEFWAFDYIAFRLGAESEEFNLGFGIRWRDYGFDYAGALHELGTSHRFSASLRFGPSVELAREERAEELYQEGMSAISKGYYQRAVQRLSQAFSINPKNRDIKMKLDRIEKVARIAPKMHKEDRDSRLFRRAVNLYLDEQSTPVLTILRYLRSLDPLNRKASGFLDMVKKEEGITKPEEKTPVNLLDQKLYSALNYFWEGRFDMVIKESQEVLWLDPDNVVAYKRMGSAYKEMGLMDKALESWRKALSLDPSDEFTRSLINQFSMEERGEESEREEE